MPVTLTVRNVRDQIFLAAGGVATGDGEPSTAFLGQLFHEIFADLVSEDGDHNADSLLTEMVNEEAGLCGDLLKEHAYLRLVGPRLSKHHTSLGVIANAVPGFWIAVKNLCEWLAQLHVAKRNAKHCAAQCELPLQIAISSPTWKDEVILTGVADALWRIGPQDAWCVAELKLGQTSPEADLAQACLYHLMLQKADQTVDSGLALVSFKPGRSERVFSGAEVAQAQGKLIDLIGKLANVIKKADPPISPSFGWPPQPEENIDDLWKRMSACFSEYSAPIQPAGEVQFGPTFIRFPIIQGKGIRVAAVTRLAPEVQVRLALESPPLIGRSAGQLYIDVQRPERQRVDFDQIVPQLPAVDRLHGSGLVPIGIDIAGKLRLADLSKPEIVHLLVAGTAGGGKSEWLRTALAGLLVTNTPETLKLVLIDPKQNAFNELHDSPFLLNESALVHPGPDCSAVTVLADLCTEMERRYALFKQAGADNLGQYITKTRKPLPRIVCVCDEYFDLVTKGKQERTKLETEIYRLGAKARAAGIHLILATQQPSREVIKGALDTNLSARVALKMQNPIESRMLLRTNGAENLLGRGDLFFKDVGDPVRYQAAFLPEEDRIRIFCGGPKVAISGAGKA